MRGGSKSEGISKEKEFLAKYEEKNDKVLNHNEQTNDQDLTTRIPTLLPFGRRPFKQINKQRVKVPELSDKKKHLTINDDKKDEVQNQNEQTNEKDMSKNQNKNTLDLKIKDVIPISSLEKILKNTNKFKNFIKLVLRRQKPKHMSIRLY